MSYSRNRNHRERARKARAGVIDVNRMARRVKRAAWRFRWSPAEVERRLRITDETVIRP